MSSTQRIIDATSSCSSPSAVAEAGCPEDLAAFGETAAAFFARGLSLESCPEPPRPLFAVGGWAVSRAHAIIMAGTVVVVGGVSAMLLAFFR